MQRFAAPGRRADLLVCARLLKISPDKECTTALMRGFEEAYRGRPVTNLPDDLALALEQAGGGSELLAIRQGKREAIEKALKQIADSKADRRQRIQLVQVFGEVKHPPSVPVLLTIVKEVRDDSLRIAALTALQSYDDASIGEQVLRAYPDFSEEVRSVAQTLLVSRKAWALELLSAVNSTRIDRGTIPLDLVRRMTAFRDERIANLINKHWGSVEGATTAEMQQQIERLREVLKSGSADPYVGKKLFTQHCAKCHTLFATGGQIGPDLTPYKRDDVDNLLLHVVNPSAEIREGFETVNVVTEDGRTVSGFVVDRDSQVIVLRGVDGQNITIPQSRIDEMQPQRKSLMPEALLKDLSEQQVRNLFAYLRSSQPLDTDAPTERAQRRVSPQAK
jgi:putative heme-binding domain-containing protein